MLNRPCQQIDPRIQIIHCANHSYFCLEDEAAAISPHARVTVFPKDTPLLSIGDSGLYDYEPNFPEGRSPELWFNLFNNMWGTNFPQWIEGNFRYRFTVFSSEPDQEIPYAQEFPYEAIPGIPETLEVVDSMTEDSVLYLMLRDHSGIAAPQTIDIPGAMLCQTDLLHRPLGESKADELTIAVRPNGLHCIAVSQ